jgi:transketolase
MNYKDIKSKDFNFGPRRGKYYDVNDILKIGTSLKPEEIKLFEKLDLIYRTLCGILYNFVPTSGHPGGSISSGRFVESIIYNIADYDIKNPVLDSNDMVVYAAGHKAMGLYAMYSLRNELMRTFMHTELPDEKNQLRFEDLLGFRRNPTNNLPLFKKFHSKALDGHPTPGTPFVKVATGASGVGVPAAFGLALGALDYFDGAAPKVHVIEGEGGMTPGRVHEAFASASAMRLYNVIMHIDFNQASIDSNRVCREGELKGDYVQWNPAELAYLHDFNVIYVDDGKDFNKVSAAQNFAKSIDNKMPTAIVYRTIKGWKYGIEGKGSHGAGHKFCSDGYYKSCEEFEKTFGVEIPRFVDKHVNELKDEFGVLVPSFDGDFIQAHMERTFWDTLLVIRKTIEHDKDLKYFAEKLVSSKKRLSSLNRTPRENHPHLEALYKDEKVNEKIIPEELNLKPGVVTTLRGALGSSLGYLNKLTNGAILGVAADLLGSTSVNLIGSGFSEGYYDSVDNPGSRILSIGGICEDAIGAEMAGLGAYGKNIGVSSSYGAFISAMEHTDARLHGIGEQAKVERYGGNYNTWILINAHAGLKTGEDGPTHADPQCLQLLQGNFPKGVLITLTPWEPGEVWSLLIAGLKKRPAVLSPFVTRPNETIADRKALKLAPVEESVKGLYALRKADPNGKLDGSIILQESGVTIEFITKVLPRLDKEGYNINVFYVSSSELFELLSDKEKDAIYPSSIAETAFGITGFTLPTMYKWVTGYEERRTILYPFSGGTYLGSGTAESVLKQAGLDDMNIYKQVKKYIERFRKANV